nr:uncharacterized protein C16orf95 homolog isoform X5 [Oryctolagus cuniculus]
MAGPPTRTQVEFLLPRRTPERAQADRPHDITGSLLCPQHSSSTGRRAPTRAPRAQGTGSGQRVPGKTARGCRRARGLAERATPSRLRGAGDSKGADDSSDPTRKSGQRGRLGRPAAAPARSLEMMYPGAQNGLREPLCCECHAHFGGRLPVPRAEAALPYWVPSSLRPREQSQRTVRFHVPKASESCPCLCHCVRGRLPVPRSQAMMPYWVPQVLRSPKKTVKRQRSFRGLQASFSGFEVGTFSFVKHFHETVSHNQGLRSGAACGAGRFAPRFELGCWPSGDSSVAEPCECGESRP